uniref:Uncharacterized protein n=1 Tax=Oryza punctata TaxID=4537 RepID=A0A0E0LPI0_ORYPU
MNLAVYHMVLSVGGDERRRLDVEATEIELFDTTQYMHQIDDDTGCSSWPPALAAASGGQTHQPYGGVRHGCRGIQANDAASSDHKVSSSWCQEFTDLGVDLWVMEDYGAMDERWKLRHRVVLPWQLSVTLERPLLIEGGDDGDVIMHGNHQWLGDVQYNIKRFVVTVKPPDVLLLSRNMLRESLLPQTFFNNQQLHPNPLATVSLPLLKD